MEHIMKLYESSFEEVKCVKKCPKTGHNSTLNR